MSDNQDSEILENFACGIHHFHIDHNASCLPPKFCITTVFDFSWDDYNTQEKLETMVMQILGGKQDALWSMWKWWIPKLSSSEKERKIQYLESGIRSMGSRIRDCCGFPYMSRAN